MRRRITNRRGGNAIEFALTFPIWVVLTFGLMEFGLFFSQHAVLNSAVMDGCREGSLVDELEGSPAAAASQRMTEILNSAGMSCGGCSSATVQGSTPDRYVSCTVVMPYEPLVGHILPPGAVPNDISAYTQARLEWQRE